MTKYLLDTNICIYLLNESHPGLAANFAQISLSNFAISSATLAELYFGAYHSKMVENNIFRVQTFAGKFRCIDIGKNEAKIYGKLRDYLIINNQKNSDDMDILIASTAIANNLVLITNNVKDFVNIPNLNVENWVENL